MKNKSMKNKKSITDAKISIIKEVDICFINPAI